MKITPVKGVTVAIIGSGPAGYSAAIYAARAELNPLLIEGIMSGPPGGQLVTTTIVENYPGFPDGVLGSNLMDSMKNQAVKFGTRVVSDDVEAIDMGKHPFEISCRDGKFLAESIIVATGAFANRLDIPGTRDGELWQRGVTACAMCDGANPVFRGKELYVIGGGDGAVEEALFLTRYGSRVYLVHRRDQLRASRIMARRALEHDKIEVLWNRVVVRVQGDSCVDGIVLKDTISNKEETRSCSGVFFAVGHTPNTVFLNGQLQLDDGGYIIVEPGTTKTSVPGVFAAGDVQDRKCRQAIFAAGMGCYAFFDAHEWLNSRGCLDTVGG